MRFQQIEHFGGEQRHSSATGRAPSVSLSASPGQKNETSLHGVAGRSAGPCPAGRVGTPSSMPVTIILAMSRRQMVIRSRTRLSARSSAHAAWASASNSVGATKGERSKPKKIGACLPVLARVTFAVGL